MSLNISRQVIEALLPPGSLWVPEDGDDLDRLIDGIAENHEQTRLLLASLARLRNPRLTPVLSDLEKEYGIVPDDSVSEDIRRARLLATKNARAGNGTDIFMQDRLREAGFDVYVHVNNPPVDPNLFLFPSATSFGGENAFFGNENAFFGGSNGQLIVNGPTYTHPLEVGSIFGGQFAIFGNENALFTGGAIFEQVLIEYEIPSDPGYWPLFFFVGGAATRDGDGKLVSIELAEIPVTRQDELVRLIVKYKPIHSWCGLVAKYI